MNKHPVEAAYDLQTDCIRCAVMFYEWGMNFDQVESFIKRITWAPWKFRDTADPVNVTSLQSFKEHPDTFHKRSMSAGNTQTECRRAAQHMVNYIIQESESPSPRITDYDLAELLANRMTENIWHMGYERSSCGKWMKRKGYATSL